MKKLLMIGGTQFVGRAIAEEAHARGYELTLFHRGKTAPDLLADAPRVHHVLGDRKTDLDRLQGEWDAVIDCVGYFPADVAASANHLRDRVAVYAFISTVSVYAAHPTPPDEDSPLLSMPEGADPAQITGETYGPLKVQCEQAVDAVFADRRLHIRAGLQTGPNDHTARFSDWVERIGRREAVLVPGGEPMPWQQIDARDTARFTLDRLADGNLGVYNVDGPVHPMPEVLETIRATVNPACRFVEASPEWLASHDVAPWRELALWVPAEMREGSPIVFDVRKAEANGLVSRPIGETIADIWAAVKDKDPSREQPGGLRSDKEDALLTAL